MDLRNWVGIPYAESNCLQLAVSVARSRGHEVPELECPWDEPPHGDPWWSWWDDRSMDGRTEPGDVLVVPGNPRGVGTLASNRYVLTTTPATGSMLVPLRGFICGGLLGVFRPRTTPRLGERESAS